MVHMPPKGATGVAVRKAVLESPEAIAKLDSVELSVFRATTDRPFEMYDGAELVAALADKMEWIAKDIGLRNTNNADYKVAITRCAQILKRYYPELTLKEIRVAFELTITGELNDYYPKDRNGNPDKDHYQMFTPEYFCKVVNAYKAYRRKVVQKAMAAVPKPDRQPDAGVDDFYRNEIHKDTVAAYLYYKYHGMMPQLTSIAALLIYEDLQRVGLVDELEITAQEQRLALRRLLYQLAQKNLVGDKMRVEEQGISAPEVKSPAMELARYRLLKQAFARMVDDELQITDYIKLKNGLEKISPMSL